MRLYEQLSFTIDRPTLEKLNQFVQRIQAERPAAALSRSEIIRQLILEAMAAKN